MVWQTRFIRFWAGIALVMGTAVNSDCLAVIVEFDYSYDGDGFFDAPERREVIEAAAAHINRYVDSLAGIHPGNGNSWFTVPPIPPFSSDCFECTDLEIPEDTLRIIIGGNGILPSLTLATTTAKEAGLLTGTPEFERTITTRGQDGAADSPPSDYGPWGATIMINSDPEDVSWHFGLTTEGLEPHETDFMTVLMHELMHVFGIGSAMSFQAQIEDLKFTGRNALAVGSRNNTELALHDTGHWEDGTLSTVGGQTQESLLNPIIHPGRRLYPTRLDRAAVLDAGWEPARTGDSNLDKQFDELDLVLTLQSSKYRTGEVASWKDGDWTDDLFFDQSDLIDALAEGLYLKGPYAALREEAPAAAEAEDAVQVEYDPTSGSLAVNSQPGSEFTAVLLESESGIFRELQSEVLDGIFDFLESETVFKASFGGSFSNVALVGVAPAGLARSFLKDDLTVSGAFDGGGSFTEFDLVVIPEPMSLAFALLGSVLIAAARARRFESRTACLR